MDDSGLVRIHKQSVGKFQREQSVDFGRVIPISFDMTFHYRSNRFRFYIWPRKGPRIEQHFSDVVCQLVAIPHSEMENLVPPEPDALQVEWSKQVVHLSDPLWHPVIVGIFSLEQELKQASSEYAIEPANATIGAQFGKRRVSFAD
jgi:hypothetical protein